ncbi:MAG: hypothetical protein ACRDH5_08825, partial [bacterium]
LGHGLMLSTGYDLDRSLELCAGLLTDHDRGSCYGGAFMENLVAYINSQTGGHVHGDHEYAVDPDDWLYPCNAVPEDTHVSCWLIHTSLVLYYNGGDFEETAGVCAALEAPLDHTCYASMGRDASAYMQRDPPRVAEACAFGGEEGRDPCIRGFLSEVVLNYVDPRAGLDACRALPEIDKPACYGELGQEGLNISGAATMEAVCAEADDGYEDECRAGAGLPPA